MGYVFDFRDAKAYNDWRRRPDQVERATGIHRIAGELLSCNRGERLIDVGCGTGEALVYFNRAGLHVTGLDPSPYMLDFSAQKTGERSDLHRGAAEALPFDDNAFDYALMLNTLEFVESPGRALEELFRVAKNRVVIGFINRYAIKADTLFGDPRIETLFNAKASCFSLWDIRHRTRSLLGDVPIKWRTLNPAHLSGPRVMKTIAGYRWCQKNPFACFCLVAVTLMPRFRIRPLVLEIAGAPVAAPVGQPGTARRQCDGSPSLS